MILLKQADAERIAENYARGRKLAPFVVDGSELIITDGQPIWRIYLGFIEDGDDTIGLPDSTVILVDAITGEPSHVMSL